MTAYYNEIDPFAAAWLRELVNRGQIAPGKVDERSIVDLRPSDLEGFDQCHFFAGIGVWSYALRCAGWADDRPVWTGSCPCQPFSAAGKGGGFDDERHLWPAFFHLISECRPTIVIGEQVASKDGLSWLDLVQADLEGAGYATGAVDLCAAGVGAPHIRQRLWWVGERLADAASSGSRAGLRDSGSPEQRRPFATNDVGAGELDNPVGARLEGQRSGHRGEVGHGPGSVRPVAEAGEPSGLADASREGRREVAGSSSGDETAHGRAGRNGGQPHGDHVVAGHGSNSWPGPTNGLWRDADWLFCRDGKWRPVEPSTFPLAHGAPSRVGRLRGYGNAINAEAAQVFIESYLNTQMKEAA